MQNHPHLNRLYKIYLNENEPFRKVHRLIDCFECFIKMYTAILLSEYYHKKDISNEIRQLLYEGLRFPSLGTWQRFSDKLLEELKTKEHVFLIDGFEIGFYNLKKFVERNAKLNIINFRNMYAHGATPNNEYCNKDIEAYSPILEKLSQEKWLSESLTFINSIGNVCIKNKKGQSLSLFPILVIEKNDIADKIVFFNDLDYYNGDVGLLNYITAHRYREKELFKHFSKRYKLAKWQDPSLMKERQKSCRIDDLTLNFTGRENEKQFIYNFIDINDKGFLAVTGNPGMGKSTLLAETYKHYESRNSGNIHPILYFIQRGLCNDSYSLLNYLHDKIDETKIVSNNRRGNSSENMFLSLQEKLSEWPIRSRGKKLLIIIDGLDEGIEPPNNFITDHLVNQTIPQVLFIYSSRPGGHDKIIDFLDNLPRENTSSLSLAGLTKENIRALLYEVTDKYKLEQNWVDIILKKSQGSALYLKLLCKEIQNERIIINNGHELPNHINDCYDRIFKKYRQFPERDILLNCIFIFAVAKDSLTKHHLELILGIGPGTSLSVLSIIKEILSVDENNQNAYFLFHESLRDYILNEFSSNTLDAHKQIVAYCTKWKTLQGKFEQQYTLKYFANHLAYLINFDNGYISQLYNLANNKKYQQIQLLHLKFYNPSYQVQEIAMTMALDKTNENFAIDFSLNIVQLFQYEQNSTKEILNYFKKGETEIALERIKNLTGENLFIMYMLCLYDTLFDKEAYNSKKGLLEILINNVDKNVPKDSTLLNWTEIFPISLILVISYELYKLNIKYFILWERSEIDETMIKNILEYEINIPAVFRLTLCLRLINLIDESEKFSALILMQSLAKKSDEKEILYELNKTIELYLSNIDTTINHPRIISEVCIYLVRINEFHRIDKLLEIISKSESIYCETCMEISCLLLQNGNISKSKFYFEASIDKAIKSDFIINVPFPLSININYGSEFILYSLSKILISYNEFEKATHIIEKIGENNYNGKKALIEVYKITESINERYTILNKIIHGIDNIEDSFDKSVLLADASLLALDSGNESKAVELANRIPLLDIRADNYASMSEYCYKNNNINSAELYIKKSETIANDIPDYRDKLKVFSGIAIILFKNSNTTEGLRLFDQLNTQNRYNVLKAAISKSLVTQEFIPNVINFLNLYLVNFKISSRLKLQILIGEIKNISEKIETPILLATINTNFTTVDSIYLKSKLAKILLRNNEINNCEIIVEEFINYYENFFEIYYDVLIDFLIHTNQHEKAINLINQKLFGVYKGLALGRISKGLIYNGSIDKALGLIEFMKDETGRDYLFRDLILALVEKGEISLAKEYLKKIGAYLVFLKSDTIIKCIIILIKRKEISIIENLIEELNDLDSSCMYQICIEFAKAGFIEKALKYSKIITSSYHRSLFDYYNNIHNNLFNSKYLDKALFEAEKLGDDYDKKISQMEIGYILMNQNLYDSLKISDLFKTKGDQIEYIENLCFRYTEKNGLKKAVDIIELILNEDLKIIWVKAILKEFPTNMASFENLKVLMKQCKKYPKLLSQILIEYAAYYSFYAPKIDYETLNSLNSIIDINEFLFFVPKRISD